MFIAILFITAKTWKQAKSQATEEWIKKMEDTYTMEYSVQFSSVAQSCPTLCDLMNRSTPGLPIHHQLLEFTQTRVHRVSDAIQPSHPLSSPSSPAHNGILLCHKKEQNSATCSNMDGLEIVILIKVSQRKTDISYDITYM